MAGRPKQPKCQGCGKALYRSLTPQRFNKEWQYVYCRNMACNLYGDTREHVDSIVLAKKLPEVPTSHSDAVKSQPMSEYRDRLNVEQEAGEVGSGLNLFDYDNPTVAQAKSSVDSLLNVNKELVIVMIALLLDSLEYGNFAKSIINDYDLTEYLK